MNQSKTYYLVRHGLATHGMRGYGKRKLTAPILPEGVPSIERLARTLIAVPNSSNISSEIIRCRETSAIISRITGKQFIYDKRLNEDNHETVRDVRERVWSFLQDISLLPQPNLIICTHGIIIAAIKNLLINNKFVTSQHHDFPLTGELVIIEGKSVKTVSFN